MKDGCKQPQDHSFFPSVFCPHILHPTPVWKIPGKHLDWPRLGHILDNLHGSESKRLLPAQLWVVHPPVSVSRVWLLWLAAPITVTWVTLEESAPQQNWVLFPEETQSGQKTVAHHKHKLYPYIFKSLKIMSHYRTSTINHAEPRLFYWLIRKDWPFVLGSSFCTSVIATQWTCSSADN